jgi:hypothetical protein
VVRLDACPVGHINTQSRHLGPREPGEVIPLHNLCAVAVMGGVESTSADVPHGAEVRSRTEEAVRNMGLEVVPLGKADPSLPLVRATFRVLHVEPGTYAYLFELSLQEPCRISRNGVTTICTAWKRQILGSAQGESEMPAALDGALRDLGSSRGSAAPRQFPDRVPWTVKMRRKGPPGGPISAIWR